MKSCVLAVILAATSVLPALAMSDKDFESMAEQVFQPVIKEFDIPGFIVGVSLKGKHYLYAYGDANREAGLKVTGDTIFELGSISKLFNVTLAAMAEQQGHLDLNSPVSTWVPNLNGRVFDRITLTDLATHTTSGLPLQVPSTIKTENELMTWLRDWKPISDAPMRSYSNVSIGLLGHITAKAMKTTYAKAVEDMLLPLFSMRNTFVNVPKSKQLDYAYGYSRDDNRPIRVNRGVFSDEAYGLKSSANDMLKFLDVSLGKTKDVDLRAAIATTQTGRTRTEFYTQDMLWEQYPWPVNIEQLLEGNSAQMVMESQPVEIISPPLAPQRDVFLNKTGATNGFGAYVALLPSEEIGVVVLANRNYPNEERVIATYKMLKQLMDAD